MRAARHQRDFQLHVSNSRSHNDCILAALIARDLLNCVPQTKRAQGTPGALGTRSPCALVVSTRSSPQVPRNTRHSLRNGLNGFLRALPGDEFLFVTVAERIDGDLSRLGRFRLRSAWHQQRMPGPHDFAVRSDLSQTLRPAMCDRVEVLAKALKRRSSARPDRSRVRPALRSRPRARRCHVHRIPSRVRDDRDTPLFRGWDG